MREQFAASSGNTELCRYLLQFLGPLTDTGALALLIFCASNFYKSVQLFCDMFRLFIEGYEIDLDFITSAAERRPEWWRYQKCSECMQIALSASSLEYKSLPLDVRFANAAAFVSNHDMASAEMILQAAALNAEKDDLRSYSSRDGWTILHLLALTASKDPKCTDLHAILRHVIAIDIDLYRKNDEGRTALGVFLKEPLECHADVSLRPWVSILEHAGVDIKAYGQHESDLWQPLCPRYWASRFNLYSDEASDFDITVRAIHFGATPGDWKIIVERSRFVPVFERRPPPGSWESDACPDTLPKISLWRPHHEPNQFWTCSRRVRITPKLRTVASSAELEHIEAGTERMKALDKVAQDDASFIALALLRTRVRSPKRSSSHPLIGRTQNHSIRNTETPYHSWLDNGRGHLCNLGNGWKLTEAPREESRRHGPIHPGYCVRHHGRTELISTKLRESIQAYHRQCLEMQLAQAFVDRL